MLQSKLTIALGSIYHTLSNATVPPNSTQYFAKNTLEDVSMEFSDRLLRLVTQTCYSDMVYQFKPFHFMSPLSKQI